MDSDRTGVEDYFNDRQFTHAKHNTKNHGTKFHGTGLTALRKHVDSTSHKQGMLDDGKYAEATRDMWQVQQQRPYSRQAKLVQGPRVTHRDMSAGDN